MILDERNEFLDATSVVINIGNQLFGDVIDLGTASRDIGNGEQLYLVLQVDTAVTGSSSTLQIQLCSDSTANLATSKTIHIDTGAIAEATLVAGYTKVYPLPWETYERYLGIWGTVAAGNLSTGKLNAFLTRDVAKWVAFSDGI